MHCVYSLLDMHVIKKVKIDMCYSVRDIHVGKPALLSKCYIYIPQLIHDFNALCQR